MPLRGGRGAAYEQPSFVTPQEDGSRKRPLMPEQCASYSPQLQPPNRESIDFSDERQMRFDNDFGSEEAPAAKRERKDGEEDRAKTVEEGRGEREGGGEGGARSDKEEGDGEKVKEKVSYVM